MWTWWVSLSSRAPVTLSHSGRRQEPATPAAAHRQADLRAIAGRSRVRGRPYDREGFVRQSKLGAREMLVPWSHAPGEAQADFGKALVVIAGVECMPSTL